MSTFFYPLGVQTVLPQDYRDHTGFASQLQALKDAGYDGVELNIADPSQVKMDEVRDYLGRYNLEFTGFASGLTAKTYGLSLSHSDESVRKKSMDKIREIIDLLEGNAGIGIILGYFKGGAGMDAEEARIRLVRSLEELAPYAEEHKVNLVVEAINRYENSIGRSLEETAGIVKSIGSSAVRMLPDTFHMNIEEADMFEAMETYLDLYDEIHLSDNNRFFPGFGAIDFIEVLRHLKKIGFTGRTAFEGNIKHSFEEDAALSAAYLKSAYNNL